MDSGHHDKAALGEVTIVGDDDAVLLKGGTVEDRHDMTRVGKSQVFHRNFEIISVVAFNTVLINAWAALLITCSFGLIDGGLAGLVWMTVVAIFGYIAVVLSLAELASMAPTSGGQYHWVSEFAPPSAQKPLSFIIGWLCVLAWQTGVASGAYPIAAQIQGLLLLNDPSYSLERWHGTLLAIAIVLVAVIVNTTLVKQLPKIEVLMLCLGICGFISVVTVLWTLAPRTPAQVVFTEFQNNGGWPNTGLSTLIGMTGPVFVFAGADAAVHMAEEVRDASRTLPVAMVWAIAVNGIMGVIMVITLCFCIGDIEDAVNSITRQPWIQIFYGATGSHAGATVMTLIISLLCLFNVINNVLSASRQMFAFARDRGLPFSSFLGYVKPGWDIPLNAIFTSFCISCLLALINIGSTVAFNAVASLGIAALLSSYIISISCVLLKRWRGEPLLPRRWSLGRWGTSINVIALMFLCLAYFFSFWPLFTPVSAETFNWSVVIYAAVILFAIGYFIMHGRFVYDGPVVNVKRVE